MQGTEHWTRKQDVRLFLWRKPPAAAIRPAGVPDDVISRLHAEVAPVLSAPEARSSIASTGVEVSLATPGQFAAFVRAEHDKWARVVRDTGATIN